MNVFAVFLLFLGVNALDFDQYSPKAYAKAIQAALYGNFQDFRVRLVRPVQPEGFMGQLGGTCELVDAGSVDNLLIAAHRQRFFDIDTLVGLTDVPDPQFVLAAAAVNATYVGCNGELAGNCLRQNGVVTCESRAAIVSPCSSTRGPDSVSRNLGYAQPSVGPLANVIVANNNPEVTRSVIQFQAFGRVGDLDIGEVLRQGLATMGNVAMAGVVTVDGKATYHIMPAFPDGDLTMPELAKWLTFWNTTVPMSCATRIVAQETSVGTGSPVHMHCFDRNNTFMGHYHFDVDPANVRYEGFLIPATRLVTHKMSSTKPHRKTT